jgi:hypothetical protein
MDMKPKKAKLSEHQNIKNSVAQALMMGTEMFPETVTFNQLTQLTVRELPLKF